jgi:DNA repair exonuclease SbcCD nuclease subunit
MKILHTADVHLRAYQDARWQALRDLIEVGKQNDVKFFLICGDLFDADIDAENLRVQLRELFTNTGFKVLIVPGNHDRQSYKKGTYFGENVFILSDSAFEYDNVRFFGLSFEQMQGEELLRKIRALRILFKDEKKNILLCHGELLDAFFSRMDFGIEGEARYMPMRLSYFQGLNADYVLAGHFHSRFEIWRLDNGGYFVYPGSPISITAREIGQRKVNIFKIGEPPSEYLLDTPHFGEVVIELDPFADQNPVETIRRRLGMLHPKCKAILTVYGFVNSERIKMTETDLVNEIRQIAAEKCHEEHYYFKDITTIIEDDLFAGFVRKIEEAGYGDEKIKVLKDMAIRAMMGSRK